MNTQKTDLCFTDDNIVALDKYVLTTRSTYNIDWTEVFDFLDGRCEISKLTVTRLLKEIGAKIK